MDDIWQDEGGRVSWLENPGDNSGNWKMRRIGNSPAMHRLKAGHFTRKDRVQIVGVPIITKSSDLKTPAPIIIYTAPDDPKTHESDWESKEVWTRLLVHEVVVVPSEKTDGSIPFDQIVLAGADGVDVLWFNGRDWEKFKVGEGLPPTPGNPFYGAGSVAVGRIGGDYAGYICCAEVREQCLPSSKIANNLVVHRHSMATPFLSIPKLLMLLMASSTSSGLVMSSLTLHH